MDDTTTTDAAPDIGSSVTGGDPGPSSGIAPTPTATPDSSPPMMNQPAQPAVNPKLNRTFLSTLKGLALGFLQGNVPGAIQGAIDPSVPQRVLQQKRAVISAQVADTLAKARAAEVSAQNLPQQLRDEHDAHVLSQVKYLTENYGAPDEVFENSSEAAHEALQNHVVNGNVPLGHILSDSQNTYVWHAAKATENSNAYDDVHNAGVLNGNPALAGITQGQWGTMSANDKSAAWATARQILTPVAPSTDAKQRAGQIQTASRQLQTAQALPDGVPSKAGLVNFAQTNLDILNKADNDPKFADKPDEDSRAQFLQGVQSSNLPGDLKKTYSNFVNQAKSGTDLNQAIKTVAEDIGKYQTSVDAAKQKQQDAQGGTTPEWKPKVSADEKKKAELAENIAFNANEVNSILAKRPDLVGAVSGRVTNVEQMIGNNDADISAIGTAVHNLAMANSGVHGFRSQEGVKDTEGKILNSFKNGPKAVGGALNEITSSVQTFIDDARPQGYQTHSSKGGALAYYQKQAQQKQGDSGNFFGAETVPTR